MKAEIVRESELVSPVAYARLKGLSLSWVYSLLWLGALPATKVDGKWRIEAGALPVRPKRRNRETCIGAMREKSQQDTRE
jgi:hypothetical protein